MLKRMKYEVRKTGVTKLILLGITAVAEALFEQGKTKHLGSLEVYRWLIPYLGEDNEHLGSFMGYLRAENSGQRLTAQKKVALQFLNMAAEAGIPSFPSEIFFSTLKRQ